MLPPHSRINWLVLIIAGILFSVSSVRGQIPNVPRPAPDPITLAGRLSGKQRSIEEKIKSGNLARNLGNYKDAYMNYLTVQKLSPKDPRGFYGVGNLYFDINCYAGAIEAYGEALSLRKDDAKARIGLGNAYLEERRYDDAQAQFQTVVNSDRRSVDAIAGLGLAFAKKGNHQKAIETIKSAIEQASREDKADLFVALGDVYFEGQANNKEAIANYKVAIGLEPDFAKAYFKLATVQLLQTANRIWNVNDAKTQDEIKADVTEAVANMSRAKERGYDPPEAHVIRAFILATQFHYQESRLEIAAFFKRMKALEREWISAGAAKCESGFNLFNAAGYAVLSVVAGIEATLATDKTRKIALLKEAANQMEQATQLKEDFPGFHAGLAVIYSAENKNYEAIEEYKKAIRYETAESANAANYESLALVYRNVENNTLAIENLKESIRRDAKRPTPYRWLAEIYIRQSKPDDALEALKKADELEPSNPATYVGLGTAYVVRWRMNRRAEDYDEGIRLLKKVLDLKSDYPNAHLIIGQAFMEHGRADDAVRYLRDGADHNPDDPNIQLHLARVYAELKVDTNTAIAVLKKAVNLKPDFGPAHGYLARLYVLQGNSAAAIEEGQKDVGLEPSNPEAHLNLGGAYLAKWMGSRREEDFEEAIRTFNKAIEVKPDYSNGYLALGTAFVERGRPEAALLNLQRAGEYNSLDPNIPFQKARVYGDLMGDVNMAITLLRDAIKLNPDFAFAHWQLGRMFGRQDNVTGAVEEWQKAIALVPNFVVVYFDLAFTYRQQGNYAEAIKSLKKVKDILPGDFHVYKELAKLYEDINDNDEAVRQYQEAIKHLGTNDAFPRNLYGCRIDRLRGHYDQAIACFQKITLPPSEDPGVIIFDIGLTYVASRNKQGALGQYQQLTMKSPLAQELMRKIDKIK